MYFIFEIPNSNETSTASPTISGPRREAQASPLAPTTQSIESLNCSGSHNNNLEMSHNGQQMNDNIQIACNQRICKRRSTKSSYVNHSNNRTKEGEEL
ncbi:hypothetical protein O181_012437 [Austropuccinia psidii MF-1]|uniref:Uncharacterized protein n=1 Tax=Austropuccinia psidii MF-1 TaxID=1389203 RepID=A0A9Q3GN11_9BASI|nr:hypothetical protein [Austropuccinia psidii MF-1]